MDRQVERSGRDKVLRRLAVLLRSSKLERTKPTFFVRPTGLAIEFVHIHKFSFTAGFRVHAGIRVSVDPFDAVALNGPDSDPYRSPNSPNGKRYHLSYARDDDSIARCADDAAAWCLDVAESWFECWRDLESLASRANSPLDPAAKIALKGALAGSVNPGLEARSRAMLGLP
jgi:hypothetical protein